MGQSPCCDPRSGRSRAKMGVGSEVGGRDGPMAGPGIPEGSIRWHSGRHRKNNKTTVFVFQNAKLGSTMTVDEACMSLNVSAKSFEFIEDSCSLWKSQRHHAAFRCQHDRYKTAKIGFGQSPILLQILERNAKFCFSNDASMRRGSRYVRHAELSVSLGESC